jgi:hypothetical protein
VLRLVSHQSPFRLFHLVFETGRLFCVPFGSVESVERIDKPAVPERGDAVSRVQVFEIRAVHHEKRIIDCREMDKRNFSVRCRGDETNTRLVIGLRYIVLWFAVVNARAS